jgi:hypothetical protein
MTWRRSDLRIYQNFLVEKIKLSCHHDRRKRLPGVIAALEPGAGKTGATLTALRDLLDDMTIRKALIVAPLLVAQTTWPDEFDEWEHLRSLTRTLIRVEEDDPEVNAAGDTVYAESLARYQAEFDLDREVNQMIGMKAGEARKAARMASGAAPSARAEQDRIAAVATAKEAKLRRLAETDTEIHIINKEGLRWLWDYFGRGARWPYDVMVIDDVRETRSGKKRVKRDKDDQNKKAKAPLSRFGILAAARKHVMSTIVLTGTPTPKGLEDLWGLAYLVDLGQRLGLYKTHFFRRWFHLDTRTFKAEPRDYAFKEIMPRVRDIMFSLDPKDYPQLPAYVVDPIRVRLPDEMLKRYRKFKRDLVDAEADVEAVNAGVLHGKLLQFANGSMYNENGDDVWLHDLKIEALRRLVEQMNGVPLMVAYTYQFDVDRIMKAFPKAVHLRPENASRVVKAWNNDEIEILLCHRASAGHGLNAQKGAGHMCEYGLTSDAELYLQFLKRIWRPGRRFPVINHVLIAEGTIDEDIFPEYLDPKIALQERVMKEVQVDLELEELLG